MWSEHCGKENSRVKWSDDIWFYARVFMQQNSQKTDTQYLQELLEKTQIGKTDSASITSMHTVNDETYLKVWEIEQNHVNTRWTVATFFFSISFAIFGFSFQPQLATPLSSLVRVSGML